MWKSQVGHTLANATPLSRQIQLENANDPDDWDTDPDFVNTVSEKEQRWGSKTVQGSGRLDSVNIEKLREEVKKEKKGDEVHSSVKPSVGYGGKFGVQTDRVDKSAVGFNYQAETEKHSSQIDYAKGFGGKFGVNSDRKDKSAVGFDHVEQLSKHSSQTDYAKGFGGKFGVNSDRKDKSAVGFDHVEQVPKHSSQVDYAKGFGGKFGVNSDRKDKSAAGFDEEPGTVGTNYQRTRADSKADVKGLKNRFENSTNDDAKRRAEELRQERLNKEKLEKELEQKRATDRLNQQQNEQQQVQSEQLVRPAISSKAVSSSPFKNQQLNRQNGNESASFNNKPTTNGKVKIGEQFLQKINQPSQQPTVNNRPTASSIKPSNVSNNPFVQTTTDQIVGDLPASSIDNSSSIASVDSYSSSTIDSYNSYQQQIQPVPLVEQPIVQQTQAISSNYSPPSYLKSQHSDEEDEWGDSSEPIKISPTYAAPLATYDEHEEYPSPIKMKMGSIIQPETNNFQSYEQTSQIVETNTINSNGNSNPTSNGLTAIALYDYQAADNDELSFDPNDTITEIYQVDDGWWQGRCKGRFGLFPANYVQLVQPM